MSSIITAIFTIVLSLASCASIRLPETEVKELSQYLLVQDKEGLKVAIEPLFDERKTKRLFGLNLVSEGILPVLVVAENHSSKSRYFLRKNEFLIGLDLESTETAESPNPAKLKSEMDMASGALIVTVIAMPFISTALYPIFGKLHTEAQIIVQNLKEKELLEKTLAPGGSQYGFVYFHFPNKKISRDNLIIQIKAVNLEGGGILTFIYYLNRAG